MLTFSIATPVLNPGPALKRCVGSVRAQTWPRREHLVQDGGSTDGTLAWLGGQSDLRWEAGPDRGMYDAINRAWQRSSGDILCWLNADEQYLTHALETAAAVFDGHPRADIVFGDYILIDEQGTPVAARREIPLRAWYVVNGILYAQSCAMFVRRSCVERAGFPDPSYRVYGDKEWLLRLLRTGSRSVHVRDYLATFVVGRHNLSLSREAAVEDDRIRRRYGGYSSALLRSVPRLCRRLEKAMKGCYGRHSFCYTTAAGETADTVTIRAAAGSRWTWPVAPAR